VLSCHHYHDAAETALVERHFVARVLSIASPFCNFALRSSRRNPTNSVSRALGILVGGCVPRNGSDLSSNRSRPRVLLPAYRPARRGTRNRRAARAITPAVIEPATRYHDAELRELFLSGLRIAAGGTGRCVGGVGSSPLAISPHFPVRKLPPQPCTARRASTTSMRSRAARLLPGRSFAPRCPRPTADCRSFPEPRCPEPGRMAACFAGTHSIEMPS